MGIRASEKVLPAVAALCIAFYDWNWKVREEARKELVQLGMTPVLNEFVLFEYLRGPKSGRGSLHNGKHGNRYTYKQK